MLSDRGSRPVNGWAAGLAQVQARVAEACRSSGRVPGSVRLLPVTKTHPAAAVDFVVQAGLGAVGENRVQEAAAKQRELLNAAGAGGLATGAGSGGGLRWELIGHLQSNKARLAVQTFQRVQTVDSAKLAQRLDREAALYRPEGLAVLLQVNSGDDPGKEGCSVEAAPELLNALLACPHLRVEGLMAIAPLEQTTDSARRCFTRLRELRDDLAIRSGLPLAELSMGMSGDLEVAIAEGSTLIRVGSAIFGHRGT